MPKEAARGLTEYVKEQCGDDLRTVVLITKDGWDGIYLRDDLKEEYTETVYGDTVNMFRVAEDADLLHDISSPLGVRHATIFHHETAIVMRFRYSWDEHILVSISPEASHGLLEFLGDCQTLIQSDEK